MYVFNSNSGPYVDMWPSRQWYVRAVKNNSIPARNGGYAVELPLSWVLEMTLPFEWGTDDWGGLWGN